MNNQEIYKCVKINWLLIIVFVVTQIYMIYGCVHQWGNRFSKEVVIFSMIICILILLFSLRAKVLIDSNYATFRLSYRWISVKIPIAKIENVSIEQVSFFETVQFRGKNAKKYTFDNVKRAVIIQLKNDKVYQISIKNAEEIKEEIEKRMIK